MFFLLDEKTLSVELSNEEEEVVEEEREIANSPMLDKHSDDEALGYVAGCITKKVYFAFLCSRI